MPPHWSPLVAAADSAQDLDSPISVALNRPQTTTYPSAVITAAPSSSSNANRILELQTVQLSTTLTISDFNRYYPEEPSQSFTPTYHALPDGSLVTPPYLSDLQNAYTNIIFLSVLVVVFFRNILVSGDYIRRGKIKKKGLFYLLFTSQLLGPVVLLPQLIAYFHPAVDCTVVFTLASVAGFLSDWLLITGILGIKAYLCLERSRFVGLMLVVIQMVWLALEVLDSLSVQGRRDLSGTCNRTNEGLGIALIIMQSVQAFFICSCFIFAVWKSSGVPAARGRISLSISIGAPDEEPPVTIERKSSDASNHGHGHGRRGWWDYVPKNHGEKHHQGQGHSSEQHGLKGILHDLRDAICANEDRPIEVIPGRKPSLPGDFPLSQPPRLSHQPSRPSTVRASTIRISENLPTSSSDRRGDTRPQSPGHSLNSFRTGLIPRMVLFREVMRDELCYTTFIAVSCLVVTILAIIGSTSKLALDTCHWLMLNWTVISLLGIHSFGRVVHRHEIEATLQHPWSWEPSFRTDQQKADVLRQSKSRRPWSPPISITSRRGRRSVATSPHDEDHGDPDDAHLQLYRSPKKDSDEQSIHSISSQLHSPIPSIRHTSMRIPLHHVPGITPSPSTDEFRFPDPDARSSSEPSSPNDKQNVFIPADDMHTHTQSES